MIEPVRQDRFDDWSGLPRARANTGRSRATVLRGEDKADAPFISVLLGCLGVTLMASLLLQAFGG